MVKGTTWVGIAMHIAVFPTSDGPGCHRTWLGNPRGLAMEFFFVFAGKIIDEVNDGCSIATFD